jgi:hypothetical protein
MDQKIILSKDGGAESFLHEIAFRCIMGENQQKQDVTLWDRNMN